MSILLLAQVAKAISCRLAASHGHRDTSWLLVSLIFLLSLFLPAVATASGGAPVFFSVQPGTSGKAVTDLRLGEPLRKLAEEGVYEYAPPREAPEARQVVVRFFPDMIVARLDVYLKEPLLAAALASGFGNMVVSRERPEGGREEFYYPSFQGLIYEAGGAGDRALAISFLSPRLLADYYSERFNEHYGAKRYREAAVEADKAAVVDPDYARGYLAQGLYYESQKDFDEALVRYNAAVAAKYTPEKKARAYMRMGSVYFYEKNQADKAAEAFQRAVQTDPALAVAHLEYGRFLLKQKRDAQALAELGKAVESDPAYLEARLELASAHFKRKQYAEALPHYKVLSEWAGSPAAAKADAGFRSDQYFYYAYCLAETGKREEAIGWYEKAIELTPTGEGAFTNMGWQYLQLDRPDRAEAVFRRGLAVNPRNLLMNGHLVEALLRLGRPEEAVRQAEATLALKPDDGEFMVKMARALAALGRKKKEESFLRVGGFEERGRAGHWLEEAARAGYKGNLAADPLLREIIEGNDKLKKLFPQN